MVGGKGCSPGDDGLLREEGCLALTLALQAAPPSIVVGRYRARNSALVSSRLFLQTPQQSQANVGMEGGARGTSKGRACSSSPSPLQVASGAKEPAWLAPLPGQSSRCVAGGWLCHPPPPVLAKSFLVCFSSWPLKDHGRIRLMAGPGGIIPGRRLQWKWIPHLAAGSSLWLAWLPSVGAGGSSASCSG